MRLQEFAPTLPVGTGLVFTDQPNTMWVVRARAAMGRYTICTGWKITEDHGMILVYTVVDWDRMVRGQLNVLGAKRIVKALGQDDQIDRMTLQLDDPRSKVAIAKQGVREVGLSEIIFPTPELQQEVEGEPGSALVHAGFRARLTAQDRCDRCGSQAYVAVRLKGTGSDLLFCAHDYQKHAIDLLTRVDAVLDQREELGR